LNSRMDVDGKFDINGDGKVEGGGHLQIRGAQVLGENLELFSQTSGSENGGLIEIAADSLTLKDSVITSAVFDRTDVPEWPNLIASGKGSSIDIKVADRFTSTGETAITADTYSVGDGGDISIQARDISFVGNANTSGSLAFSNQVTAGTLGKGHGGSITLRADSLSAGGSVLIAASSYQNIPQIQVGDGGNITLNVGQLMLRELAQIGTGTFGNGNSGDLIVNATAGVDISGAYKPTNVPAELVGRAYSSGIFTTAERGSTGSGGNLTVTTPQLTLSQGGKLSAGTSGRGDAGTIDIRANEILISDPAVDLDGGVSGIVTTVSPLGSGNGGMLMIESDRLHLFNGGQITASTDGAGKAGNVNIQSGVIDIEGTSANGLFNSSISSRSSTLADAGSVVLRGDRINLRDRGTVSVSNLAGGSAGNIDLISNTLYLNNGSVQAEANAGSQGNVNIESRDVALLRQGSRITTNATGTATGGNIGLKAPLIIGLENSDISANAIAGNGGNIQLTTQGLIGLAFREQLTPQSDITASSELGVSGTVTIESPSVEADSGLVQLPENLSDESNQIVAGCAAQNNNQFVSTGRGGLSNNPLQQLTSNQPWQDMRAIASTFPTSNESANYLANEAISHER
ncbi:MAG: S-layer family protein, partial [Phormidesmis sp.]